RQLRSYDLLPRHQRPVLAAYLAGHKARPIALPRWLPHAVGQVQKRFVLSVRQNRYRHIRQRDQGISILWTIGTREGRANICGPVRDNPASASPAVLLRYAGSQLEKLLYLHPGNS